MCQKRFLLVVWSTCFIGKGSAYQFAWTPFSNQAAKDSTSILNLRSWTSELLSHLSTGVWKIAQTGSNETANLKLEAAADDKWNREVSVSKRAASSNSTTSRKNETSGSGNVTKSNGTASPKPPSNATEHVNSSTTASPSKNSTRSTTKAPKVTTSHSKDNKNVNSTRAPNGTSEHPTTTATKTTGSPKHKMTSTKSPKVSHNESTANATDSGHKEKNSNKSVNKTVTTNKPTMSTNASSSHKNTSSSMANNYTKNNTKHDELKGKSSSGAKVKTTTAPHADLYGIEKSDEEHGIDLRKPQPYNPVVRLPVRRPMDKAPSKSNKPYSIDRITNVDGSKSYIPSSMVNSGKGSSGYVHSEPIERHPSRVVNAPSRVVKPSYAGYATEYGSSKPYILSKTGGSVKDGSGYVPKTSGSVKDSSGYVPNEPIERHPTKVERYPPQLSKPSNAGRVTDAKGSKSYIPEDTSGSSSQEHNSHYFKGFVPALLGFKYLPAVDNNFNSKGYVSTGTVKDSNGYHYFRSGSATKEHVYGGHGADVIGARIYGPGSGTADNSKNVAVAYVPSSHVKESGGVASYGSGGHVSDNSVTSSRGSASRGRVKDADGSRLYVPWGVVGTTGDGGSSQGYASSGRVKDAKGSRQYELDSVVIDDDSSSKGEYDSRTHVQTSVDVHPYDSDQRLSEAVATFSRGYDQAGSEVSSAAAYYPYSFGGEDITEDNYSRGSASVGRVNDAAGSRYYDSHG